MLTGSILISRAPPYPEVLSSVRGGARRVIRGAGGRYCSQPGIVEEPGTVEEPSIVEEPTTV